MESFESFFFYGFSTLAVIGAFCLVILRNPVSSAMSMVASFIGLAALFIGLNAYFVGIIQILVYAGAIMVLFLFIIMLLDLQIEARKTFKPAFLLAGIIIPLLFLVQLLGVLETVSPDPPKPLALEEAAPFFQKKDAEGKPAQQQSEIYKNLSNGELPDVNLVGLTMFGHSGDNATIPTPGYNFPLQMVAVLLLVATVGVVALSLRKKTSEKESLVTAKPGATPLTTED